MTQANMSNSPMAVFPALRLRRLRQSPGLRRLIRETVLDVSDLVYPLFIRHGHKVKQAISSMPGCFQLSLDNLAPEIDEIVSLNIPAVVLFGIPASKDPEGKVSCDDQGVIQSAIRAIKQQAPDLVVIADVCLCEYTDHGHCGVISDKHEERIIDNDLTLPVLAAQALSLVRAGADVVAPSGMMDGMVQAIRQTLDANGFSDIPILSYSAKYASALYGPFREAAEGPPKFGDRKSYQIDPANGAEALRENLLDLYEGADMLMIKPAHAYLDIIYRTKQAYPLVPLGAYHVSGEYSMLKAAAEKGWIDEKRCVLEIITGIKRAGADFIITYYAKELARWLAE